MDASIFDLARTLTSTQDMDKLLSQISQSVEQLTQSEAASILLLDEAKKNLVFKVATGEKGAALKKFFVPMGKGIAGWVAENGKPLIINDVKADTRFTGQIDKSSGFSTRSILALPMFAEGQLIGVCEALNKIDGGYNDTDQAVMEQLAGLAATTLHNARVAEDHKNFFSRMIDIVTLAIEGADTRSTGHSYRVAELACRIGRQMKLKEDDYRNLYYAALLHDIGMIAVHDLRFLPGVINKTIERTPEKLHPLIGSEIIKDIRLLGPIGPYIRHHHEFVDGSGHPDGLVGDDIPLISRIICLAEYIDELRMKGFVGEEFDAQSARLVTEGSGVRFDKDVVDVFLSL